MIQWRFALLALLPLLFAACVTSPMSDSVPGRSEDKARMEMLRELEASAAAWNRGDLKGHLLIYDESVTVMTKTGPRPTIAAIQDSFGKTYFEDGKAKQTLGFGEVSIRLLSADSALMTGRFTLTGGGLPTQSGWFTLVWLNTATGWRVVHDHTS